MLDLRKQNRGGDGEKKHNARKEQFRDRGIEVADLLPETIDEI